MSGKPEKKKINYSKAFAEAKELIWHHRWRLALGLVLMLISRSLSLVLPASTKYVIDEVIGKGRGDMLWKVAAVALGATMIQAITAFILAQVLGVAGLTSRPARASPASGVFTAASACHPFPACCALNN